MSEHVVGEKFSHGWKKLWRTASRSIAVAVLVFSLPSLSACMLAEAVGELAQSVVQTGATLTRLFTGASNKDYTRVLEEGTAADIQKALDEGMNVNASNQEGFTALMLVASKNPHPESVRTILAAGAELNSLTKLRYSAFFYAAANNPDLEITQILLAAGSELDIENIKGMTPLGGAMANPNPEVARFLIASGADVNHRAEEGYTPLMVACRYSTPAFVELLLESGAEVNAVQMQGRTALMFAAAGSPYPEIIDMLVHAGANVAIRDMDGKSALAMAREQNSINRSIEEALVRAGAR